MPENIFLDASAPLFEEWDCGFSQDNAPARTPDVEFLTLAEAAVLVRRSERTLRAWRNAGLLRTHKIGRAKLIYAADLLPLLFGDRPQKISNDYSNINNISGTCNSPFDN